MCKTCGCGDKKGKNAVHAHFHAHDGEQERSHSREHTHARDHEHSHDSEHDHEHTHDHNHEHNHEHGGKTVDLGVAVLAENDRIAMENRMLFDKIGATAVNLISSPGAGKTSLLEKTLDMLKDELKLAVLEGDCETDFDARRIAGRGVQVHQITTGGVCHLDAHMVAHGLESLQIEAGTLLFIENVGNLVCPADFLLGEKETIALLSVAEGDDKPMKYPAVFDKATALVITKIDLLPYVDFDVERAVKFALTVNPRLKIFRVSAKTGDGMQAWTNWLKGLIS